jgi:hypothetical protein
MNGFRGFKRIVFVKKVCIVSLYYFLLSFIVGCGAPGYYEKRDSKDLSIIDSKVEAVKVVKIKDYVSIDDNIEDIQDSEKEIKFKVSEAVSVEDFFTLLKEKGLNVVLKSDDSDKAMILIPEFKGKLRSLLRAIQDSTGVFIRVRDNVITVLDQDQVSVKVLYSGQENVIVGILKSYGVEQSKFDQMSSRVVFKSDYVTYKKIKDYFQKVPLSVAVINVVVIETELNHEEKVGIDWGNFSADYLNEGAAKGKYNIKGSTAGDFTLSAVKGAISMTGVLSALESYKNFKVVQNTSLSVINGQVGKLDVSEKIPYVSEVNLTALSQGQGTSNSVVQGFKFESADAGLVMSVTPLIDESIVTMTIELKYQSIIDYVTVGTKDQGVSRPIISARNVSTVASMKPGELMTIGCLRYKRNQEQTTGLWKLYRLGREIDQERWFEVSALLGVSVVKYVLM